MAKLPPLSDLTSLTNETEVVNTINNNNDSVTTAFTNTISRDGSSPNFMNADFDMNSFRILNSPDPILPTHLVTLQYGNANFGGAAALAAAASAAAAAISASDAAQSAIDAANQAAKLIGTSTTANTIGAGSKTFTTQVGKYFDPGANVMITSDANPAVDFMFGTTTFYPGTGQLDVNVVAFGGSGSHSDWTIRVAGARGATGATGGGGPGTGDLLAANNLSDLADIPTASANLGLGSSALQATTDFLLATNNLSDLTNVSDARDNLGLGTGAVLDAGTAPFNLVQLDAFGRLPAIDGSLLTNVATSGVTVGREVATLSTFLAVTGTNKNLDDVTPTTSHGVEVLNLPYEMSSSSNTIKLTAHIPVGQTNSCPGVIVSLFDGNSTTAVASQYWASNGSDSDGGVVVLSAEISPATVASRTYAVRIAKAITPGNNGLGSAGVNAGITGTSRILGGATKAVLIVEEFGSGQGGGPVIADGFVDITGDTFTIDQTFTGLASNIGSGFWYTFDRTVTFPIVGGVTPTSMTLTASASDPIQQQFTLLDPTFGTPSVNTVGFDASMTTGPNVSSSFNGAYLPPGVSIVNASTGLRFTAGTKLYFKHDPFYGAPPTTLADIHIVWVGTTAV